MVGGGSGGKKYIRIESVCYWVYLLARRLSRLVSTAGVPLASLYVYMYIYFYVHRFEVLERAKGRERIAYRRCTYCICLLSSKM